MNNDTIDQYDLPDDLYHMQSALAELQPSEMQTTSAEMLFSCGLAAGVKMKNSASVDRPATQWKSFAGGIGTGVAAALIAIQFFSSTTGNVVEDSIPMVENLNGTLVRNAVAAQNSHGASSGSEANDALSPTPLDSELVWERLRLAMHRQWNSVGTKALNDNASANSRRTVSSNFLTGYELRRLAAEIL